jgi:hypothetical protein
MTATTDETFTGIEIMAGLSASIGNLAGQLEIDRESRRKLAQAIHPFTIPPQPIAVSGGAGSLDQPNILGPRTGKYWDLRRISCTGFSAGTVTVYLSQSGAEMVGVFSAAGVLTLGKAHILLGGNDRLYFSAASITGTPVVSIAGLEIDATWIGEYLI